MFDVKKFLLQYTYLKEYKIKEKEKRMQEVKQRAQDIFLRDRERRLKSLSRYQNR